MSVMLDTQVSLPAPYSCETEHKTSYQSNTSTYLLMSSFRTSPQRLVCDVHPVSSGSSVPGFPGSLALGCLSNTASLCWTAAHWTSQGPHVHKGMFGWIRYIATHTPLVCLFDSTNVIWHLNWVREVPVVRWAQTVDGDPSRELLHYSGPEEAAETVRNSKSTWRWGVPTVSSASYFISFL